MDISRDALRQIMPLAAARLDAFVGPLNVSMDIFNIDSPFRQAAFLAQLAHESGELRYVQELASGEAYEGRVDLGNTQPGDGVKFKGRGPIQITGRTNYRKCSLALFGDERLLDTPKLLSEPADGCMAAGWFWKTNGLNQLADMGDFRRITRIINGGYNGLADREMYYKRAKEVLGVI